MFRTGEVEKITGIPRTTINFWAQTGFIKPSLKESTGTGNHRLYSLEDVVRLRVAGKLREEGVPLQKLRWIVNYLKNEKDLEKPLAEAVLVVSGDDVEMITPDGLAESVLRHPGQLTLVLDVEETRKEIEKKTEELGRAV